MKAFIVIALHFAFNMHQALSQTLSCPTSSNSPTNITSSGTISINIVPIDTLCTLTLKKIVNNEPSLIPLARSYDNNDWEAVAGPFYLDFSCAGSSCQSTSTLPTIGNEDSFQLTTFNLNDRSFTSSDVAARFLEQATFGPTMESLEDWKNVPISSLDQKFATWTHEQIYSINMTSHRQYLRKRTHSRAEKVNPLGIHPHPCDEGTRWHTYALTTADSNTLQRISFARRKMSVRHVEGDIYLLLVDNIPRTEVQGAPTLWGGTPFMGVQEFCYDMLEEKVEGMVGLRSAGCLTLQGGNPKISFFSQNPDLPQSTISLTSQDFTDKFVPLPGSTTNDEYILTEALTGAQCDAIGLEDYPVYINFNDGTFLAFDPRINPLENTVDNPLPDGGGQNKDLGAICSNVPRTFLNAHGCKLSSHSHSCRNTNEVTEDREEVLTSAKITSLYNNLDRYVYAINGLIPDTSPCVQGSTSRWERLGPASACNVLSTPTYLTLSNRLELHSYFENELREIKMLDTTECDVASTTPSNTNQIMVVAQSSCWGLVHPDHHNVYDMTPWVTMHPGGADKITSFAQNGLAFLDFPQHHDMSRWEMNKHVFGPQLGVYNQLVNLRDFPDAYEFRELALDIFGAFPVTSTNVVVCGSPNEVANDLNLVHDGNFEIEVNFWDSSVTLIDKEYQKQTIWAKIAMHEPDQLRQRMAFAISQIFAIQPVNIITENTHTRLHLIL